MTLYSIRCLTFSNINMYSLYKFISSDIHVMILPILSMAVNPESMQQHRQVVFISFYIPIFFVLTIWFYLTKNKSTNASKEHYKSVAALCF